MESADSLSIPRLTADWMLSAGPRTKAISNTLAATSDRLAMPIQHKVSFFMVSKNVAVTFRSWPRSCRLHSCGLFRDWFAISDLDLHPPAFPSQKATGIEACFGG